MRKPVIAGNWKMNMTCTEAIEYMRVLIPLLKDIPTKDREVVIAPPFTALHPVSEFIKDRRDILSLRGSLWPLRWPELEDALQHRIADEKHEVRPTERADEAAPRHA